MTNETILMNEINELIEDGQFDDACEIIEEPVDNYIKYEYDSEGYDSEGYLDESEYIKTKNFEKEFANESTNLNHWADKMDLTKLKSKSKATDKSDNATCDRVLDKRSLKIMFQMMRRNIFLTVKGNISAGKEANVYYAPTADGQDYVVKVYMTSIMPFKARNKYMNGDFRFRNANLSSSTKLVTTWAEKEFRNLIRINETNGAIPCPKPIKQKGMVLVMSMIGTMGEAAPKLKDLFFDNNEDWSKLYVQILAYVRILFQECRLIHADLSEYNLLYHDDKIWMIDVSQSVEHFHPEALNFLRKDCHIMNTFFRSKGIKTLSLGEFFDFVVDPTICKHTDSEFQSYIHEIIEKSNYFKNSEEDTYFLQCHIPRNLTDVAKFVEDYKKLRSDANYLVNCPYASVTGMTSELKDIRLNLKKSIKTHKQTLKLLKKKLIEDEENDNIEENSDEEIINNEGTHLNENIQQEKADNSDIEEENTESNKINQRKADETKEEKRIRKKLVKEQQRNKRVENKKEELKEKARTIKGFKRRNLKQ